MIQFKSYKQCQNKRDFMKRSKRKLLIKKALKKDKKSKEEALFKHKMRTIQKVLKCRNRILKLIGMT